MKNSVLLAKQFCKNKVLAVFSCVFFVVGIFSVISGIISCFQSNAEPLEYLLQSLSLSMFVYVYFMFISNEYLHKIKQCGAEEVLRSLNKGYYTYYLTTFSFLIALALLYSMIILAINLTVYNLLNINNSEYLWHIFKNVFLNIFLTGVVAILFGGLLSFAKSRMLSYTLMLFMIFLSTPLFEVIGSSIYAGTGVSIYPLHDLFNIFPPLLDWAPLHTFGYSLLPYRVELILFWMLLFSSIQLFLIFRNKRKINLFSTIGFCLSLICLISYLQPTSKVTMSEDPDNGALADVFYYSTHEQAGSFSSNQFVIEKYDLNFEIGRDLQANVTLYLEDNELTRYDFTLYHEYKVKSVIGEEGNRLKFTQSDDYISVETDKPLKKITMIYSGSSVKCFSNSQGIMLPGWFAYYPHPGHFNLYDTEEETFVRTLCPSKTKFSVIVNTEQKIYCNLNEINKNTFEGYSEGVTLVNGFYDSYKYNGIEIVYPNLAINEFSRANMKKYIDEYKNMGIFEGKHKKIFVMPNTNSPSVYERFCSFSDHITLQQLIGLPEVYEMQKLPSYKLTLYNAYNTYKSDEEQWDFILEVRKEMATDVNKDDYLLLDKAFSELDEKYVEEQVSDFLDNDDDKRAGFVFLKELLEADK